MRNSVDFESSHTLSQNKQSNWDNRLKKKKQNLNTTYKTNLKHKISTYIRVKTVIDEEEIQAHTKPVR